MWGHFKIAASDGTQDDENFGEAPAATDTPAVSFVALVSGQRVERRFSLFVADDQDAEPLVRVWRTEDPVIGTGLIEEDDDEAPLLEEIDLNDDPLQDDDEPQQGQGQGPNQGVYVGAGPPHFRYTIRALSELAEGAELTNEAARTELHHRVTEAAADICAHLRQHLHGMAANDRAQRRLRPHEMAQTVFLALPLIHI